MSRKDDFPLPRLDNPLSILDSFGKAVQNLGNIINNVDSKIRQIDNAMQSIDRILNVPPTKIPIPTPIPTQTQRKTSSGSHFSYEGQTEVDYCIECAVKHGQTAKVLLREAIQRAMAASPDDPGVIEKVRGAVEELVGMEDDTETVKNDRVALLNKMARSLRKYIYAKGAEIGKATLDDLKTIKEMTDKLVDAVYKVRQIESECIACKVEDICGTNLKCLKFIEEGLKKAKTKEEAEKVLNEARERFKGEK